MLGPGLGMLPCSLQPTFPHSHAVCSVALGTHCDKLSCCAADAAGHELAAIIRQWTESVAGVVAVVPSEAAEVHARVPHPFSLSVS